MSARSDLLRILQSTHQDSLHTLPKPFAISELGRLVQRALHAKRHNFTAITSDHGDISKDGISCDWPTEIARQITRYLENCESNTKLDKNYGIYRQILPLFDKPVILYALHKHRYNQVQAAKFLGINRNTLKKRMTELGITIKKSP